MASAPVAFWAITRVSAAEVTESHVITIETMKFSPEKLRIRPGESVTFRNSDLVPHTATSRQSDGFDSGTIKPGESWTIRPKGRASIHYACTFHPTMTGEIVAGGP